MCAQNGSSVGGIPLLSDVRPQKRGLGLVSSRRIRLWALLMLIIIALLALQGPLSEYWSLPRIGGNLAVGVILALFLTAVACEYVDSSLGMGYGTTLTPLLLLAGFEPLQIVPAVLFSEFCTGITAGLLHHRDGNVDLLRDKRARYTAVLLSGLSMVGVITAVTIALHVPKQWLTSFIAIIILSMGLVILATIRRQLRFRAGHILGLGAIAAFNKGMSGGGYGPLVTGGQVVSGMSVKQAVAVTSLAEGFTCFVGLAAYLLIGSTIDWSLALPLTIGALMSVPMATLTVRKIPERAMRAGVGVVTCLLGLLMIVKLLC